MMLGVCLSVVVWRVLCVTCFVLSDVGWLLVVVCCNMIVVC